VKKKITANTMIAAAETTIRVLEFDLVGCFVWGEGNVTLDADAEGSAPGTVDACG
jgi:hypothetical protein